MTYRNTGLILVLVLFFVTPAAAEPTVTINQASDQADPTGTRPILFDVLFSESVSDFATDDITLSGDTGATTAAVSDSGTTYTVSVTGMTGSGSVTATISAGAAHDDLGNANAASTSTDNIVTYDATAPTVFLSSATANPTNGLISVTATSVNP